MTPCAECARSLEVCQKATSTAVEQAHQICVLRARCEVLEKKLTLEGELVRANSALRAMLSRALTQGADSTWRRAARFALAATSTDNQE